MSEQVHGRMTAEWRRRVRVMRGLCPLAVAAALVLVALNWKAGNTGGVAVSAFCAGVSSVLTWIQWKIFKL
jgi:hypothetical protein